jgi:uncharacterized protein
VKNILIACALAMLASSIAAATTQNQPASATSSSHGPSFSCIAASDLEKIICADPALADRDRTMASLYTSVRTSALGKGESQEIAEQRKWVKSRNMTCSKGDSKSCLVDSYDTRLNELAIAALFTSHDMAMAELTRQNSKTAPVYEAIYRYATIQDLQARTQAVTPLINPIFEAIHDDPWATQLLADIPDAKAATASDQTFAPFLDVVSVSDYTITLPCRAIVNRPGLIDALSAQYGGAIDGRLIQSDCEATLPATPALSQVRSSAVSVQPFCQGSIRFTLGHNYQKLWIAVRLHQMDLINMANSSPGQKPAPADFLKSHDTEIDKATEELGSYYSNYFDAPVQSAKGDAKNAVKAVLTGAFNLCMSDG